MNFRSFDNHSLILMATVNKGKHHDFAVDAAKEILAERNIDLSLYNEDFYINEISSGYGNGWEKLIRAMLDELRDNGWNRDIIVRYKEKYGRFEMSLDTDNSILSEIIEKHLAIINGSCMICGKPGENVDIAGWEFTYCEEHFIEKYPIIYDVDKDGFTIDDERFLWEEISEVKILSSDLISECTNITEAVAEIHFHDSREMIILGSDWLNWYHLLKTVPNRLSNPQFTGPFNHFTKSLIYCPVCEFRAVYEDHCLRCRFWMSTIHSNQERAKKKGKIFIFEEMIAKEREELKLFLFFNKLKTFETSFER